MKLSKTKNNNQSMQNETKAKALRLARKYLQTRGINGFSFQDIADELEIKKASLHYYFTSKDSLIIELLTEYLLAFNLWTAKYDSQNAKQKLKAVTRLYCDLSGKDYRICPIGALTINYQSLSAEIKKNLKILHFKQKDWLTNTLRQGQQEKLIDKKISPEESSDILMTLIQGSLQIARLRNDDRFVEQAISNYLQTIQI